MLGPSLRVSLLRASLLSLLGVLSLACGNHDDEGPVAAAPAATNIPTGAPQAEGAQFDPVSRAKPAGTPRGVEMKIEPLPDPDTPPSPFTQPPGPVEGPVTPPPPAPTNIKKKSKGTTI